MKGKMFNLTNTGRKERYTQTFLGDETTGPLSWGNWVFIIGILSAHTLLIIATIFYVCGSHTQELIDSHASNEHTIAENFIQGKLVPEYANITGTAVDSMNTTSISTTGSSKHPTKTTTTTPSLADYLINRGTVKTELSDTFITASKQVCSNDEEPFLVILCVTKHYQKLKRSTIRRTWGTVAKRGKWPREKRKFPGIKLVFLLGHPAGHKSKQDTAIADEEDQYGDIIQADFIDSSYNASMKILLGLRWVQKFCPQTKFVLRVSDDHFVHVANIVKYLESTAVPQKGLVLGHKVTWTKVQRKGRWALSKSVYPYDEFPQFVNKNSYVLSGNAVVGIESAAPYLPYVFIEDAFITGILRSAADANLISNAGFMKGAEPRPKLCGFHNNFRFTSFSNPSLTLNLWKSLNQDIANCYTLPEEITTDS